MQAFTAVNSPIDASCVDRIGARGATRIPDPDGLKLVPFPPCESPEGLRSAQTVSTACAPGSNSNHFRVPSGGSPAGYLSATINVPFCHRTTLGPPASSPGGPSMSSNKCAIGTRGPPAPARALHPPSRRDRSARPLRRKVQVREVKRWGRGRPSRSQLPPSSLRSGSR